MSAVNNIQPGQAGQMGGLQRPKQRFIDKVLMRQQDDKLKEAAEGFVPSGAAVMGMGPGTNLVGGPGAFTSPNTLSLILGGK